MGDEQKKSFSALRPWGSALDLVVRTLIVLAVVVMINYLGTRWHQRVYLSSANRQQLSPQTLGLVQSITNQIKITLFYDRDDEFFPIISDLLNEYRDANPKLEITVVDYLRDAGAAAAVKEQYKSVLTGTNKDFVIFDCAGRPPKPVPGSALSQFVGYSVDDPDTMKFREQTEFYGERMFNAALMVVLSPKPIQAYYLAGHGEHLLEETSGGDGYGQFKTLLKENYITLNPLSLLGTNSIPADCNLLILAGPRDAYQEVECDRINAYLREGGRLLALANSYSLPRETGMEKILAWFGIDLKNAVVRDPKNFASKSEMDVYTDAITPYHEIGAPLQGSRLRFWMPRPIFQIPNLPADAPRVQPLVSSSEFARVGTNAPRYFTLAVAVEKGAVKNVVTERGSTRVVAIGDSIMFADGYLEDDGNKEFLMASINWLLDRTSLMKGPGKKPMDLYRLSFTASQFQTALLLMLAGIPGAILGLGALVWLRRRK
jgi:hypothetical protein